MVRLVVLIGLLALSGCSMQGTLPQQPEDVGYAYGSEHPAVVSLMQDAQQAAAMNNWSKALSYLDQARRIEPRNPSVLLRQAEAYGAMGEADNARSLLQRARMYAGDDGQAAAMISQVEAQLNSRYAPLP